MVPCRGEEERPREMHLPQHGTHDGQPTSQHRSWHDRIPQDMHGEGASRRGFGEAPLRVVVARKEFDVVASLLQSEGGIDDEALGSSCAGARVCARREESGRLCGEEEKGRVSSLSQRERTS